MRIHVKLGEPLWRAVGSRRLSLEWLDRDGVSVETVLARLAVMYSAFHAAYGRHSYRLFIDAAPVTPDRRELVDGQTLFIMLPAIGGSSG